MDFWSTISVKSSKSPTSSASYCFLDSCLFPQPATFEQTQFLSSHTYPSFSWASRRHSLLFPPREGSHQRQRSWHCIDLSTQKSNLKHFHVYSTLCWVVTFQQPLIEDRERKGQLTIDGGSNHAGESSEKGEKTKCRCEVVQPGLKENKLK